MNQKIRFNNIKLYILYRIIVAVLVTFFSVLTLCLLLGCQGSNSISTLERKHIFSLEYGSFEDQLNLFNFSGERELSTSIVMRDGFFYIANGESKKIMEMNSYGDLITFYYNEEVNPAPSYVKDKTIKTATRKAVAYPFNEISSFTVDSRRYLYAVDKLPLGRQEQDQDKKNVLSRIVLRFDGDGNFIDYIGQQGPGGTPFPLIKKIYANKNNELIVVCYTSEGYCVYWFTTEGYLLYKIPIENKNVPDPFAESQKSHWSNITGIIPDYKDKVLYLLVDYYTGFVDETVRMESGIQYEKSILYPLNVEDGTYGESLDIPPYSEQVEKGLSNSRYDIPYDFLGVTDSGWLFFIVSAGDSFSLQMIQRDGQRILKRELPINRKECLYYTFDLSNSGILSALLIQNDNAIIDWWRTDSLIQSVIKE